MIPLQLSSKNLGLGLNHVRCAQAQVVHRDIALHGIAHPIHGLLPQSSEIDHSLEPRLAGDSSRVEANASHHVAVFDDGNSLPHLCSLDRCIMSCRPAPKYDDVILFHSDSSASTP